MVLCDGCIGGYHLDCLRPALDSVPEGNWLCDGCLKTASSSGRQTDGPPPARSAAEVVEVAAPEDIVEDIPTLHFLKMHEYPDEASEPEKARIKSKSGRHAYIEDRLVHQKTGKPIPEVNKRARIIQNLHKLGHFGGTKTTHMVQQRYWWWGLTDVVQQEVKNCKLLRHTFNEPAIMTPIPVHSAFHKVGLDLVGPLQRTAAGNRYMITCVDYMTKWVEAIVLPDKTSKRTAEFLYSEVICRHGCPAEEVTGQGGEFQGEFQELLDKFHIDHRLTSPYHPQANGLTERFNQTLTKSLIKMTQENEEEWDKQLLTVLLGYRATIQASTRYTPYHLLHGKEMMLPMPDMARLAVGCDDPRPTAQAMIDNLKPLQKTLASAKENIAETQN